MGDSSRRQQPVTVMGYRDRRSDGRQQWAIATAAAATAEHRAAVMGNTDGDRDDSNGSNGEGDFDSKGGRDRV